jgi:hypothetical protein
MLPSAATARQRAVITIFRIDRCGGEFSPGPNGYGSCTLTCRIANIGERHMKALAWHGKGDIRCDEVPDPKIEHPRDAIIKVTACAICGSDLHIYGGIIPEMRKGDVLGHENMGEVVEVGSENKALKVGDRVVVPFTISCGECFFLPERLLFRLRAYQP